MSQTFNSTSTSADQSTVFPNLHDAQKAPVSYQARNLLTALILWSGDKKLCWWGIPAMAREFGVSEKTVRRWKQELIGAGLVQEISRPGRASVLIPFPVKEDPAPRRGGDPSHTVGGEKEKGKIKVQNVLRSHTSDRTHTPKRGTSSKSDAIKQPRPITHQGGSCFREQRRADPRSTHDHERTPKPQAYEITRPPKTIQSVRPEHGLRKQPCDMGLVREIEELTRDHHSRGAFIRIARAVDEQSIRIAMSATQAAMLEVSGTNGGAYFIGAIRNLVGFTFSGSRSGEAHCGTVAPDFTPTELEQAEPVLQELEKPQEPQSTPVEESLPPAADPVTVMRRVHLAKLRISGKIDQATVERCETEFQAGGMAPTWWFVIDRYPPPERVTC